MRAMVLEKSRNSLQLDAVKPVPEPGAHDVLLRVRACGVCRTDLHVVDGELDDPKLPLILGHEIVGVVEARGALVERVAVGERIRRALARLDLWSMCLLPERQGKSLRPGSFYRLPNRRRICRLCRG